MCATSKASTGFAWKTGVSNAPPSDPATAPTGTTPNSPKLPHVGRRARFEQVQTCPKGRSIHVASRSEPPSMEIDPRREQVRTSERPRRCTGRPGRNVRRTVSDGHLGQVETSSDIGSSRWCSYRHPKGDAFEKESLEARRSRDSTDRVVHRRDIGCDAHSRLRPHRASPPSDARPATRLVKPVRLEVVDGCRP